MQRADVLSAFARKGIYDYALMRGKKMDGMEKISAAMAILYALDAINRYEALGLKEKAQSLRTFIRGVRAHFKISKDPQTWALQKHRETLENVIRYHIRSGGVFTWKPWGDAEYATSLQGAHTTATLLYDFLAGVYRNNLSRFKENEPSHDGIQKAADYYSKGAQRERALAGQLGLRARE